MTAPAPLALGPLDLVPGRSFAHPDHIFTDKATMRMLITDFCRHIEDGGDDPIALFSPSTEDWFRRVIIPRPADAAARNTFAVVGFFGRRRDDVPEQVVAAINELGRRLIDAIPAAEGVLGYITHLLVDEKNYANLVVFDSTDSIEVWRETAPHPVAASEVSPSYYEHVRIYRGIVDVQRAGFSLALDCVKYWDFRDRPTWHAVRVLAG